MTAPTHSTRPPAPRPRLPRVLLRGLAVVVGLALALLGAEGLVRLQLPQPAERVGEVHAAGPAQSPLHPAHGLYALDSELGFRPRLGGPLAAEHGCRPHEYALEKPAGVTRLLFVGDSVTHRGALVDGLRAAWGDEGLEYWNAGVEGYGLHQVDRYHARYLSDLDADHVLLTFHLNDFSTTPVTFLDGDQLVVYATDLASTRTNRWLFRHSHLYRLWIARRLAPEATANGEPLPEVVQEVEAALVTLRDRVEASGARFTVLLFPWLAPRERWPTRASEAHARALTLLERHDVRTYDLVEELEAALAEGLTVRQRPKDAEHPSEGFGGLVGRSLAARGLQPE